MVNVIIPVYNNSDVLRDALRSLENQTKKMFITTVVDDCSTEDIKAVCDEFKDTLKIIYVRQEENGGPGKARQRGLDMAAKRNIEYIMFLDSDDILYPRAVEILSREISRSMTDMIISPIQVEKKNDPGWVIPPEMSTTWLHGKILRTRALIDNNIRFSEKIRYNEDAAFNTLTYNLIENKAIIEEIVYLWRDYSDSITRSNNGEFSNTCYPEYITGLCESLEQLVEKGKLKNPIENLCALYNGFQNLIIRNYPSTEIQKYADLIGQILKYPIFSEELKKKESFKKINDSIKQGIFIDKDTFKFYCESFWEWLENTSLECWTIIKDKVEINGW